MRICGLQIQYTTTQNQDSVLYICLVCGSVLFISFPFPQRFYSRRIASFCSADIFFYRQFLLAFSPHSVFFLTKDGYPFLISISFISLYVSLYNLVKLNRDHSSGKYAKNNAQKIDTNVMQWEKQNGRPKDAGSEPFSSADVTDPDEVQRFVYGVDLNRGSGFDLIFIEAVLHRNKWITRSVLLWTSLRFVEWSPRDLGEHDYVQISCLELTWHDW